MLGRGRKVSFQFLTGTNALSRLLTCLKRIRGAIDCRFNGPPNRFTAGAIFFDCCSPSSFRWPIFGLSLLRQRTGCSSRPGRVRAPTRTSCVCSGLFASAKRAGSMNGRGKGSTATPPGRFDFQRLSRALGHREDVWLSDWFRAHISGVIKWAVIPRTVRLLPLGAAHVSGLMRSDSTHRLGRWA